jgi:hypothetical protein
VERLENSQTESILIFSHENGIIDRDACSRVPVKGTVGLLYFGSVLIVQ